jgi:hypothetical protein
MPTGDYKVVVRAAKTLTEHQRRFNAPTLDKVAIVMVGNEFGTRDVQKRNNTLQRIPKPHRSYDALQHLLIFWQGGGYHFQIPQTHPSTGNPVTGKKVTAMDFYAYRI